MIEALARRLDAFGLIVFGGFHPGPGDGLDGVGTLVLIGNAGSAIWPHLAAFEDGRPDPLDRWTRQTLEPLAEEVGARALFPFDKPPLPFLTWAMSATPARPSPLGMLIHPDYGLWHAYRVAFAFADRLDLPEPDNRPTPCPNCAEKPCLSACPVGAFSGDGYDVPACTAHLSSGGEPACLERGCAARRACPAGADHRYESAHQRFHMEAFFRSRAVPRLRRGRSAGAA